MSRGNFECFREKQSKLCPLFENKDKLTSLTQTNRNFSRRIFNSGNFKTKYKLTIFSDTASSEFSALLTFRTLLLTLFFLSFGRKKRLKTVKRWFQKVKKIVLTVRYGVVTMLDGVSARVTVTRKQ